MLLDFNVISEQDQAAKSTVSVTTNNSIHQHAQQRNNSDDISVN